MSMRREVEPGLPPRRAGGFDARREGPRSAAGRWSFRQPDARALGSLLLAAALVAPVAVRAQVLPAAVSEPPAVAAPAPVGTPSALLPAEVEASLRAAQIPREAIAIVVQEVDRTMPARLAWQAQRPMNPASLMKLLPTAAALELLGPAWTWTTSVWLTGVVRDGVLDGSVVIRGSGDPKLVVERVWLLLRRVQQLGVREIRGDIVLDRSAFSVPESNPGDFDGEPFRPYNASPDALLLNYRSLLIGFHPDARSGHAAVSVEPALAGLRVPVRVPLAAGPCGDWRSALRADLADPSRIVFGGAFPASCGERFWPVAPADPRGYNARLLQGLWAEMGGRLAGTVRDGAAPAGEPPTFEVSSPPLAEVTRDINKFSNNVMAQQLFLTLALQQRGRGTVVDAREVLRQWLVDRFGPLANDVVIDNGSGLSRESRASAQLLARLLQAIWASPAMPELAASLPVTGIDGTARRIRAEGARAHLKTGSLRDVAGVAGYVHAPSGRRYALVVIVNHPNAAGARPVFDALVRWTAADGVTP
ncbi:MAG: D-alanyl-D-alanine carboxypeptidase/D-alanyl-D-alanine-endopeptidase [Ideonella sp.]|jgi:D-alanyl-D-alanine carboxypeptidase/D-alanyl-D-alanine-endopeptidase (penicillin-binding protein 4)|nr:D-alanyl-D-alanine carboxypeptidase/D-alanyl-D-alanine-endopeptidase [Ideonella sp.]